MAKYSGNLSKNRFKINNNGEKKTYIVKEKKSAKIIVISEDYSEKHQHITRIAFYDNQRVGTIDPVPTGLSFVLNTNN